jgi:Cu(I)/Ag(I) efflux system membrane fusion protein
VILHRGVTRGAAVDPSTELFVIADLSRVWILAEVPESRMSDVTIGAQATLELESSGVRSEEASVEFVYPTLTESTRTLRVRFVIDNPDGSIRPGAFGTAVFHLQPRTALVVPRDAVVDHGTSQYVFVAWRGRSCACGRRRSMRCPTSPIRR